MSHFRQLVEVIRQTYQCTILFHVSLGTWLNDLRLQGRLPDVLRQTSVRLSTPCSQCLVVSHGELDRDSLRQPPCIGYGRSALRFLLVLIPCCYHSSSVFTLVTILNESATNGERIPSHRECERGGFRDAENITSPHSIRSIQAFVPPSVSSPLCVVADSVLIAYNLYHSFSSSPSSTLIFLVVAKLYIYNSAKQMPLLIIYFGIWQHICLSRIIEFL